MKTNRLDLNQSYTFSSYFDLNIEPEEILAEFNYSFARKMLDLPNSNQDFSSLSTLKDSLQRRLPFISLTSEIARREVLIAPILLTLIDYTQAQLRIEYSLTVSDQLKGSLDYYLHTQKNLLVIEAKKADLTKGFTQLAVELIALDQWLKEDENPLYGAVSTGDIWQFGRLDRRCKHIEQDLSLFRVPADLEDLFSCLVAILSPDP
ncbi:MAG: hypothetical protein VKN60_07580 [Cyanobacteriota bacterium]|nr:hypothetical protein [Cyanobacteriota bacterium]